METTAPLFFDWWTTLNALLKWSDMGALVSHGISEGPLARSVIPFP